MRAALPYALAAVAGFLLGVGATAYVIFIWW